MGIGPPKKSDVAEGNGCVAGNCFWFVWREWPRETPSAFIDNEIDLLWHNEEKILKPKTPGCLEHKFCETNGYPVGNGTMEKKQKLSIRKRQNDLRTGSGFTLELEFGLFIQIFYFELWLGLIIMGAQTSQLAQVGM